MNKGTSAMTSVNAKKVPALFTLMKTVGRIKEGTTVFDYGCGRYPEIVKNFVEEAGGEYAFWDPNWFPADGDFTKRYDLVCLSNVLNVIPTWTERVRAVYRAWELVKPGGRLVVSVYEADGSGASGPSKPGCWQERRPLESYITNELADIHGSIVRRHGKDAFVSEPKREGDRDHDHFNDGLIDIRFIPNFCLCVAVSCDGRTEALQSDDNLFGPADVVYMYRRLWDSGWNMDDEREAYEEQLKEWLLHEGAEPDALDTVDSL